jgi:hypothetical protein
MTWVLVITRGIHILSGVFWAGSAFAFSGFIEPTASAVGPDAGRFMQRLAGQSGYPRAMSLAAILSVLSGVWLYWKDSAGFRLEWITSGPGVSLSVGAIAGLSAALVGMIIQARASARLAQVASEIQQAGGPPSESQRGEMELLRNRLRVGGRVTALLLLISVAGMGLARYLPF